MSSTNGESSGAQDRMLGSTLGAAALGRGPVPDGDFSRHEYHRPAAGWGAARSAGEVLEERHTPVEGVRALFVMNQERGGFDCPGCAWPDDPTGLRLDICENSVKHVTWKLTRQQVGRDFAAHTVSELAGWTDYDLEAARLRGRVDARTERPMRYRRLQHPERAARRQVPRSRGDAVSLGRNRPVTVATADGRRVADAMVTCPKTLGAECVLEKVQAFFEDDHVHMALVVAPDGRLVTTIERPDLDADPSSSTPVAKLGTLIDRTVGPADPLAPATVALLGGGRRRLAVVDDSGRLLGLLCLKQDGTGCCSDEGIRERAQSRYAAAEPAFPGTDSLLAQRPPYSISGSGTGQGTVTAHLATHSSLG